MSTDVSYPDARAVVLNEDELQSALFHCYLDICGLCIQTEDLKQILVSRYVSHAAVDIFGSFHITGASVFLMYKYKFALTINSLCHCLCLI